MSRRVKVSVVWLLGVAVVAAFATTLVMYSAAAAGRPITKRQAVLPPLHPPTHTQPFIDGGSNPEAIPDEVAYRMLLRMLMRPEGVSEGATMQRAYVRYVLRMGAVLADDSHISHDADTCDVHQNAEPSSKEIDAVLRFVQSYEGPLRVIDARRQKLGKTGDLTAARALQPERDRIVAEAVRSLPGFVGKESAGKIDLYVRAKFKKSTKIFL